MIRCGVIGFGKMGRLRHHCLEATGRARVVAVHDPHAEVDANAAAGAEVRTSVDAILDDPTIAAVCIATVNGLNRDLTIRALAAGKHVLCEKPPAFNAAGVMDVMAAHAGSDRVLMYGFNHRQHGAALAMKRLVDSGEYGRILWMRGRYGKSVDADYLSTWRADPSLSGGGILLDQGIHMLDLFLYLGGGFDEVHALVSSLYWEIPGIEDNVFAIMRNKDSGLSASLHSTMTQWRHLFSLEVFLERGYMVLNGLKTSSNTYGQEKLVVAKNRSVAPAATWEEEETHIYDTDISWDREVTHFLDAIEHGARILNGSSQHALEVMRLVDQIYDNERHHAAVRYKDLNAPTPAIQGKS